MVLTTYGRSSGFCVDPIEKKPLNQFYPGSSVFSFGTAGCNLGCRFCQNWDISKSREFDRLLDAAAPEVIARAMQRYGILLSDAAKVRAAWGQQGRALDGKSDSLSFSATPTTPRRLQPHWPERAPANAADIEAKMRALRRIGVQGVLQRLGAGGRVGGRRQAHARQSVHWQLPRRGSSPRL